MVHDALLYEGARHGRGAGEELHSNYVTAGSLLRFLSICPARRPSEAGDRRMEALLRRIKRV